MHIRIKTSVSASFENVKKGFNQDLFLVLNPPFPPVKLLHFDGCEKGDRVSLALNFLIFKQNWVSTITDAGQDNQKWWFIDEGVKLPFFLRTWHHRHIIERSKNGSVIMDDITYTTGTFVTDLFLLPILYLQFLYRKPVYRKWFGNQVI